MGFPEGQGGFWAATSEYFSNVANATQQKIFLRFAPKSTLPMAFLLNVAGLTLSPSGRGNELNLFAGEFYVEGGAFAVLGFEPDSAVMVFLDDSLHDVSADAGSRLEG